MIAILLAGWILVTPPTDQSGSPLPDAPYSEWKHEKAFDSADDCEARGHTWLVDRALTRMDLHFAREGKPMDRKSEAEERGAIRFSRCVPDYVMYPPPPGAALKNSE